MQSFIVSHPHVAAVSLGVAESLARAGELAAYVTGVAAKAATPSGWIVGQVAKRRPRLRNLRALTSHHFHQQRGRW